MPLQELITPENLPAIMTAFGGILGGGGIITLIKVRREPPKPGTPDAAAVAKGGEAAPADGAAPAEPAAPAAP